MGRRRSAALVLACWLVAACTAACTYTPLPAESSAHLCTGGLDEDEDGVSDCKDPDCWGFAHCRENEDAAVPMSPFGPPPSGVPAPPGVVVDKPIKTDPDSSVPVEMPDADVVIDASVDAEPDAELPPVCSELCPPDKCEDGVCTVPLELGEYEITHLELLAPRERRNGVCFDERGNCPFPFIDLDPLAPCCPPDPTVIIRVGEEKVGLVGAPNTALQQWDAPGVRMQLREGDEVTFEVIDDDNPDVGDDRDETAQSVFSCSTPVTLAKVVEMRALRCSAAETDRPDNERDYRVVATIEPVTPEAP